MMDAVIKSLWSGLPALVGQFLTTAVIFVAGIAAYVWLTPFHELKLVRQGNLAAGITLAGAVIGLALPLGATLAHSVSVADIAIWGAVSAALQALTFGVVTLAMRGVASAIEQGNVASAVVVAAVQIGVGIINAGAMSS
jgi:putative membrane protein